MFSGIQVHMFLVRLWSVTMVDVCVMGLLLKKASIMTCTLKTGKLLM